MASSLETLIKTVPKKNVFRLHFLQSLSKIKRNKPSYHNSDGIMNYKHSRKIKAAAYESMARAAGGTRRPWTRALLWKLRIHRRQKKNKSKEGRFLKRKRVSTRENGRGIGRRCRSLDEDMEKLRSLVPGCGGMETCRLMEETAHYVKSLSMQVKVMQSLVDRLFP